MAPSSACGSSDFPPDDSYCILSILHYDTIDILDKVRVGTPSKLGELNAPESTLAKVPRPSAAQLELFYAPCF